VTVTSYSQFELARAYAREAGVDMRAPRWLVDRRIDELAVGRAARSAGAPPRRPSGVIYYSQFELARAYARGAGVEMRASRWLVNRRIGELAVRRAARRARVTPPA
jgi:hypothetical protein